VQREAEDGLRAASQLQHDSSPLIEPEGQPTMSADAIYERLTRILRDVFDDETITATPDLSAEGVAGWDSLAHLRVMLNVEEAFHVSFAASQMAGLRNIGELASLIESKLPA
jgi:acyl carrier protein